MSGFGVLILFCLSYMFFSCSGKVNPPPNGTSLTFLNGSTATIQWSYDGVSGLIARTWSFISSDGSEEGIASIIQNNPPDVPNSSLLRVSVEPPATLILHNVTEKYNGTYKFSLAAFVGSDSSEVVVYIAVTPSVSINCSRVTTVNTSDDFTCVCKGKDGNPPAQVTWYKGNKVMATGVEEATLRLRNVTKEDTGNYTCEAKSHEEAKNETKISLIVSYPPEGTHLEFIYDDKSVNITCEAEALPAPTYKILRNGSVIAIGKKYMIKNMTNSSVGNYSCVAENILGRRYSLTRFLTIKRPFPKKMGSLTLKTTPSTTKSLTCTNLTTYIREEKTTVLNTTHSREEKTTVLNTSKKLNSCTTTPSTIDGENSKERKSKTEWYIILVLLASGFIAGIIFSYIVSYSRRKLKTRKPRSNPTPQTSQVDTTYQELDLRNMIKEDNYQSLRGNAARNEGLNDDQSNYTELKKTRDVDNNYQSLT